MEVYNLQKMMFFLLSFQVRSEFDCFRTCGYIHGLQFDHVSLL